MAVTLQKINGVWLVVVNHSPTANTTTSSTSSSSSSGSSSAVAAAASATAAENNAASSSQSNLGGAAAKQGTSLMNQINSWHKNIINNTKVSHVEENGKYYKVINGVKYFDYSDPRNTPADTQKTASTTWYDVDTALTEVYQQAAKLGISVSKPSNNYGKSITSSSQAQKILDDYVSQVNKQISASYAKQAASSKSSISNSKVGGGASAVKVGNLTTTTYDIADNIRNIQSTAKQYGVTLSGLSQTHFSSQSAAQKALDDYYAAAQKAMSAKLGTTAAAAKTTTMWQPSSIPASMKSDYDSWNSEIQSKYGKTLNPDYYLWLKNGKAGINGVPKYYLEDAMKESDATRSARAAADAVAEAKYAASQKSLQDSYDAMLKAKGTTSAKNSTNNASNQKSKNYSKGTPATFSNANNAINKISVVKAETKTDNTKQQAGSNALAKFNNKLAAEAVKSVTEKANAANAAAGKSNFLGMTFKSSVIEVKDGKAALKLDDSKKSTTSDFKKFTPLYNNGSAVVSKGSNKAIAVLERTSKTPEFIQNYNGVYKTISPVLYTNPENGEIALIADKMSSNDFKSLDQLRRDIQTANAIAAAKKATPGKSEEYYANVVEVERRKQLSPIDYAKEELGRFRTASGQKMESILPDLESFYAARDAALSKVQITKNTTASDIQKEIRKKTLSNSISKGFLEYSEDEYNTLRSDPVKYGAEVAATVAAGEVLGAAFGGIEKLSAAGGAKVASKISNPALSGLVKGYSAKAPASILAGTVAGDIALSAVPYSQQATDLSNRYLRMSIESKQFDSTAAKNAFKGGKEFTIGGIGFSVGASIGRRVTEKTLKSIALDVAKVNKWANPTPKGEITAKDGFSVIDSRTRGSIKRAQSIKPREKASVKGEIVSKDGYRVIDNRTKASIKRAKTTNSVGKRDVKGTLTAKEGYSVIDNRTSGSIKRASGYKPKPVSSVNGTPVAKNGFSVIDNRTKASIKRAKAYKPKPVTSIKGENVAKDGFSVIDNRTRASIQRSANYKSNMKNGVKGKPVSEDGRTAIDNRTHASIARARKYGGNSNYLSKNRGLKEVKFGNKGYSVNELSVIDDFQHDLLTKDEALSQLKKFGNREYDLSKMIKIKETPKAKPVEMSEFEKAIWDEYDAGLLSKKEFAEALEHLSNHRQDSIKVVEPPKVPDLKEILSDTDIMILEEYKAGLLSKAELADAFRSTGKSESTIEAVTNGKTKKQVSHRGSEVIQESDFTSRTDNLKKQQRKDTSNGKRHPDSGRSGNGAELQREQQAQLTKQIQQTVQIQRTLTDLEKVEPEKKPFTVMDNRKPDVKAEVKEKLEEFKTAERVVSELERKPFNVVGKRKLKMRPVISDGTEVKVKTKTRVRYIQLNPKEKEKETERMNKERQRQFDAINSVTGSLNSIDRAVKQLNPVKPKQTTRPTLKIDQYIEVRPKQRPPAQIQIIKPTTVIKQVIAQDIKNPPIQKPTTDQGTINPPRIDQTVKPVVDQIINVVVDLQHYQEGENQIAYLYMRRKKQQEALARRRKPKSQKAINDDKRGNAKIKRTIFNRLGSIESMFGDSNPSKPIKQTVKRARKA